MRIGGDGFIEIDVAASELEFEDAELSVHVGYKLLKLIKIRGDAERSACTGRSERANTQELPDRL